MPYKNLFLKRKEASEEEALRKNVQKSSTVTMIVPSI